MNPWVLLTVHANGDHGTEMGNEPVPLDDQPL
jgi:hypothetical protein